jgi:arabinogalactan oligomer/maltooligosaccharide transport system substrate-binding protein
MRKKLKLITMLIAGICCASMFVGCGKSSQSSAENESKEVVVWSYLMDNEVAELDKIAQEWAKENGKKVKVIKDNSPFQSFLQAANSSKGPDLVFGLTHNNMGTFQQAGLLSEVPKDFANREDYVNNAVWDAVSYDGKAYGVPLSMETYALFYNKDKVKEIPKTIEDLVKQAKAYGPSGFQFSMNEFYYGAAFVQSYGGYIFGGEKGNTKVDDIGLANDGAIKAYRYMQDLVQKDKLMPADITSDIANSSFKTGDAIFYIGGPWDISGFKDAGVNFGVVNVPKINGVDAKVFMGVQAGFVSSKSPIQDDAWKLMKYLANNTGERLYNVGNRIPVLKAELNKDPIKNNEFTQGFIAQTNSAVPIPNVPEIEVVWKPMENMTRILNGEDPAAVAKDIEKAVRDGIKVSNN